MASAAGGLDERILASFPREAEWMMPFARGLFARDGERYAAELGEDERLALAATSFRFFATMPEPVRCRMWTPTFAVDGWDSPYTIFESHLTDRPFIVDTLREFLHQQGIPVRHLLHPIFSVERDPSGVLVRMRTLDSGATKESFVHCAVDRLPDEDSARLEHALADRLHDVFFVTEDYRRMRQRLEEVGRDLSPSPDAPRATAAVEEIREFLAWLGDGHFVFLGCGWYQRPAGDPAAGPRLDEASALGILRVPRRARDVARHDLGGGPRLGADPRARLAVVRSALESTVHRAARMDVVVVRRPNAAGPSGEHRFLGLFTSKAYAETPAEVPVLREKLRRILEAEQALPESHDFREIESIFNDMPKAELFMLEAEELRAEIRTARSAGGGEAVRVRVRPHGTGSWATVILPRDRFSSEVRRDIEALLAERLEGTVVDYQLALGEGEQARLHFYLAGARGAEDRRVEELEKRITARVRSWEDRLRERLLAEYRGARGRRLAARYAALFTPEYKATTEIPAALNDIRHIESLARPGAIEVELGNPPGADANRFNLLRLYQRGEGIVLSDFLPLLENLGLRVFAEDSVRLGPEAERIVLYRFLVQDRHGRRLDVRAAGPRLAPAILEVYAGRAENDSLNRLIADGGLGWREVELLRTYRNVAFQTGAGPSRPALNDVLLRHPAAARALFELFVARFDPALEDRTPLVDSARQRFHEELDRVETAAEDRMLRRYLALVDGSLRTNFFRPPRPDHPFLTLKIHSRAIEFLPRPRPLCEIYVHSARMEGVHLRGGAVARGGIRWSDRPDDLRTEVLGLMKTQLVKNAVIVPTGAKGGFVVKRAQGGEQGAAEVRECYSTLIRGLLELTDNIVRGDVWHPDRVVRYDGDDPYLVVAADKGTATFSDLANSVAAEFGFWLGDAFASGGSHGYDHKKEGITARGAWRCVRRHFRELGKDVQDDAIDVVGIGDMSGDVFGNGMLLSRNLRLRAAFNHAHVFLDPSPDPERSFEERRRLFDLPRSSWLDYARSRLSPGGLIVARSAKAAPLTPEVRAMLGVEAERLDGEGLVRAILGAETNLLFNGGIGTYVRASGETDAEVGDHANDAVRRTAAEVHATVVAEGGNLGFTQRARVEFALAGGRINTDAIDNSAGVDLSDHEVNLKILFQPLLEAGEISPAQRNRLLEEAKEDVVEHVLAHNESQCLLLSLEQLRSQARLVDFTDQMSELEQAGTLDRALEALPDREALRERQDAFPGLTRPELAVLVAYSKLALQGELLASPWIDDAAFERFLFRYFPARIVERFRDAVRAHRLRREIIAAEVANEAIDRMGSAFTQRMARDAGVDPATAVTSFVVALEVTEADRVFDAVAEARAPAADAHALILRWEAAVEAACKAIVGMLPAPGSLGDRIRTWRRALAEIGDEGGRAGVSGVDAEVLRIEGLGIPGGVARSFRALERLRSELEVVRVAEDRGTPLAEVGLVHRRLAEIFDFAALDRSFAAIPAGDRWEKRAAEGLREDLAAAHRRLTAAVHERPRGDVSERIRAFTAAHEAEIRRLRALTEEVTRRRPTSVAAMVVVVREHWKLADP